MSGFNITDCITVITSILACIFAFLSWRNQVKSKLIVMPKPVVLSNSPIVTFKPSRKGDIVISNVGYKSVTIIDVNLVIGREKISLTQFDGETKNINIPIYAGEVKTVSYDINSLIEYISYRQFPKELSIGWEVVTSGKKCFKGKTNKKVFDVVDVNGGK